MLLKFFFTLSYSRNSNQNVCQKLHLLQNSFPINRSIRFACTGCSSKVLVMTSHTLACLSLLQVPLKMLMAAFRISRIPFYIVSKFVIRDLFQWPMYLHTSMMFSHQSMENSILNFVPSLLGISDFSAVLSYAVLLKHCFLSHRGKLIIGMPSYVSGV